MTDRCFAAIDLGTNSCRLLVCDESGKCVCKETVATKLGEGMYREMRFTNEAVERGLKCFFEYKQILDKYNVVKLRAVATASCRMAANGEEFIQKVYHESRIPVEVIDGYEEARLNLKGALSHVKGKTKFVVLYDLGGGSTEITLATNDSRPHILYTVSIPWGARNASEAFDLSEFNAENAEKLRREIDNYVFDFVKKANLDAYRDEVCWVATSSTPLRLVSMVNEFGEYDRERADGMVMNREQMDEAIAGVLRMNKVERSDNPYIGDKRSSIFVAASIIFKTIYEGLGVDKITASLKSAKDGIIEELIEEDKNGKINQVS